MIQPVILVLLVVGSTVQATGDDCNFIKNLDRPVEWSAYQELLQSEMQFTADLLRKFGLRRSADNINVVFSPFNIYNSLLVMYFMSANKTEQVVKEMFHIPQNQTKDRIHAMYKTLNFHKENLVYNKVKLSESVRANLTKKHKDREILKEDFCLFITGKLNLKSCAKVFFKRHVEQVNFKNKTETLKKINAWVSKKSDHHMTMKLGGDLKTSTRLLFVNTAFFRGIWPEPFTIIHYNQEFRGLGGTTMNVTLMEKTGSYKYWTDEDLEVKIVELPFKGNQYRMLILLPKSEEKDMIINLLLRITKNKLNEIILKHKSVKDSQVKVSIPRFKFEKTYDLFKAMRYLGFTDIFKNPFDLSNILQEDSRSSKISHWNSEGVYEVMLRVDEKGVTSSSKMSTVFQPFSVKSQAIQFKADHPFIYLVYTKTNTIALGGIFYHP